MRNPNRIALIAAAVAIAMVATLIVFRALTARTAPLTPAEFDGADEVAALFRGIPQDGTLLGDPSAPIRIVEYIDYKCPHCAAASTDVIPVLVRDQVRPGKVRMQLKPLAFIGPDSRTAAWAASAASRQNRMWQFTELVLRNQGDEGSRWVTEDYVRNAAAVAGLDVPRLVGDMKAPAVRARLIADQRDAELDEARTTPFWVITGPAGTRTLAGNSLDDVLAAIEQVG